MMMGPDGKMKKKRAKRRSKNDLQGRDFKCSFCSKTYLSYPALYTHMKTKHSTGPDGQQLLLNSGRGRGRPKKNAGRVTTINPEAEDYFKTLDKGGGPTDVMNGIEEAIMFVYTDYAYTNKEKNDWDESSQADGYKPAPLENMGESVVIAQQKETIQDDNVE